MDGVLNLAKRADETARQLTRSLMQAVGLLGMYHAELARVLHVHCADVGLLASGQHFLAPGSNAWWQAEQFVEFYQILSEKMRDDKVKIYHWLRAFNQELNGAPLLLIVDRG